MLSDYNSFFLFDKRDYIMVDWVAKRVNQNWQELETILGENLPMIHNVLVEKWDLSLLVVTFVGVIWDMVQVYDEIAKCQKSHNTKL